MDGSGSTALTRFPQTEPTVLSPTLTVTACPTCKNTSTFSPRAGTTPTPLRCWTTAFGGTAPFPSTIGTKKTRFNSTNQDAVILVQTVRGTSSCATKILSATFVPTGLTMTRTVLWIRQIPTTTAMQTASQTTTMAMVSSTRTLPVGTPTVTA